MPSAFIYLGVLLGVILIWFLFFKRPIYEAIFISFIALVAITNTWKQIPEFFMAGLETPLIYSMTAFVAMSIIMTKTKIIDGSISIILALLGKIPGGAGYVSVVASSFMGALSGSGPGNVMATGTITIPAMKRSGFPPELAANIESSSSYLGNMIPPSSNIVAALGAYAALYPHSNITTGQFWIVCWGCSLWFILHRLITVFAFCKYYKIKPMPKEEIPKLRTALKTGWQGLLLPVIIILPFVLDYFFKDTFFTERLGAAGAGYLSKSILYFIAGLATFVTVLVVKNKKAVSPNQLAKMIGGSIKSISPAISACIFGYMVGALFASLNVTDELRVFITDLNLGKVGLCLVIPLLACFLGMLIPGSSIVVIFGPSFISLFAAVGVDPLLVAAMLPCICGVMCGITPPLALGMYAGMSIAESDYDKTVKNDLWWVAGQYLVEVIVLLGLLPILGL